MTPMSNIHATALFVVAPSSGALWFLCISPLSHSFWSHSFHMISSASPPCFKPSYYVLDIAILFVRFSFYPSSWLLWLPSAFSFSLYLWFFLSWMFRFSFPLRMLVLIYYTSWRVSLCFQLYVQVSAYDVSQVSCYSICFIIILLMCELISVARCY